MRLCAQFAVVLAVCLSISLVAAQDKVVVIPLNSAKKLHNVVTVSAKGGDFTDPVAAVNSITDASVTNPYLVSIGPGVYSLTQTLVMKPFVTIAGSGREATTLKGAISSSAVATSTMIKGSDKGTLRDLTVENTGGSSVSIVLYNDNDSPAIYNASFIASGGVDGNVGVLNINSSRPTITNTNIEAYGGVECYGVSNNSSSNLKLIDVTTKTASGIQNYGVRNAGDSIVSIRNSFINCIGGYAIKVDNPSGTVLVSYSSLFGQIASSGSLICVNSDDAIGNELNKDCTFP